MAKINMPGDYATAKAADGSAPQFPKLALGGHICRIRTVGLMKTRTGKDQIVVDFDVQEGSEWDGYFKRVTENRMRFNSSAQWAGVFRTTIVDGNGNTNGYFKGFIEAVEKSNTGYNFQQEGADTRTLQNKMVGFCFGEEEFKGTDGVIRTTIKPQFAVSVQQVRDGKVEVPPLRKYRENGSQTPAPQPEPQPMTDSFDDDELPF